MTDYFNITTTTSTVVAANTPYFINTEVGSIKLFPSDISQWDKLFKAISKGQLSLDILEVSVKEVDFHHLRQIEELKDELKILKETSLVSLNEKTSNKRFDVVGAIYVMVHCDEYFEEPLGASIGILKSSNNKLLNAVYKLERDDLLNVLSLNTGDKKERVALKAIPGEEV